MGREWASRLLAALLILAGAGCLAGCGARRQQVFAYRLPNFPLPSAPAAPNLALNPDPPPPRRALPLRPPRRRRRGRARESSRLDLNRAPFTRLERVPGLSPALAARIIAARPFRAKRALLRRGFLTPAAYALAKRYLVVHRRSRSTTPSTATRHRRARSRAFAARSRRSAGMANTSARQTPPPPPPAGG